jgi:chitin disaccharide deacetylase
MKRLIVNADDFFADVKRDEGILRSAREGIVTSTTVLARPGLSREDRAALLSVFGERIGLHLNLTEGSPFTRGRTLADDGGRFWPKHRAWQRALLRQYDPKEVEREFEAQLEHVKGLGIPVRHMDGHNHIHVFPGIVPVVARLIRRAGIRWVRVPSEPLELRGLFGPRSFKRACFARLGRSAGATFRQEGLRFPDRFAGIQGPTVTDVASLRDFIETLPEETTELMCHPGYAAPELNPFSNGDREREMRSLTDLSVREAVVKKGIRLISFADL